MSDQSKVQGDTIETTVDQVMAVFRQRIEAALSEQGIEDVDADEWYPLFEFIDVLGMIGDDAGEPTLRKLGAAVPASLKWMSNPDSVTDGLTALDDGCRTRHQKLPGNYNFETTGADSGTIVADTPYPCAFDQGMIKGTAEHFDAGYASVKCTGSECRGDGGDTCTYEVSW